MKAQLSSFLIIFSITVVNVFAQKPPAKFGSISMEDMKMTVYPQDSSASAVVLFDYGEAYVLGGSGTLNFERHIRIKILKSDAFNWSDVAIYYYHDEERVSNLKASTYNLVDGKIVETELTKESIFKGKYNRYRDVTKFTMPAVKEGSIIEYSFKLNSDYATNFPNWTFQRSIPIRHSEYWAIIPEAFFYEKYMQGYLPVSNYEVIDQQMSGYAAKGHHWIVKNAPAFKEEPFMTSENDYISRINFALSYIQYPGQPLHEVMGSWDKLKELMLDNESFWGVVKGSNFLKKDVELITAGITEPEEKLKAIHKYVKTNIEWDGEEDYFADPLKKIIEVKKGTSGDINLLLASMLEKADFQVDLILLSTRSHGFIRKEYPMRRQFNYVICAVHLPDKTILMDATSKNLPFNVLPERCLNGEGLIISKINFGWQKLETKVKAKTVTSADLVLAPDGTLTGKLIFSRDGYDAASMRSAYKSKGEETYVKEFLANKTWEVSKSEFENIKETEMPTKETHEVSISDHASVAGDVIYINPFVHLNFTANPFTAVERIFPVDYGTNTEETYMCKLVIPDGFEVDELPASKVFMLPGNAARFFYNTVRSGNLITITKSFQINKSLFLQDEYPNLKEFYNQILAKQSEQIVLKKK
jgi:hypothetical protein